MTLNFPLYLRIVLVQGGCLLAGFGLLALLLPAPSTSADAELARRSFIASFGGMTASFVTTWGLLTGVTGLIFMREQRRQWIEILDRHCDSEMEERQLTITLFPTVDDFGGRPQPIRCSLSEEEPTRVSLYCKEDEENDPSERTGMSVPRTIRLRAFSGADSPRTT